MLRKHLHEENRRSWNTATVAHNSHKRDQAAFLREGGSTLFPEEIELLGDIAGQNLVHLQCNAGQDTLSLAQRGAIVTGVDISDEAIQFARDLSQKSAIAATFVRADVYDWLEEAARSAPRYDVVFSSYGFMCWLSDLDLWARQVAAILKPNGRLVLVEFHPFAMMFEEDWSHAYPYFHEAQPQTWDEGVTDYVAASGTALAPSGFQAGIAEFANPHRCHCFEWGIGEMLSAVLGAGLSLAHFQEYPYSNGAKLFDRMRELPGGRMVPPEDIPNMPLMFSLVARRP